MNDRLLSMITLLFLVSVSTSCEDNCCTLSVNTVCEGDSECSGFATWEECQSYLNGLGYDCE